jgi:hypothetical protein
MLNRGSFTLLGEETYESEIVVSSISKGMNALLSILRTHNIFPIEPQCYQNRRISHGVIRFIRRWFSGTGF